MIRKCKKAEWGKDGAAELAIKKDIEDSWKKKSGNYCCMCLFFFSLSQYNFSAFWDYNSERERDESWVGSLEWQWNKENGKTRRKEENWKSLFKGRDPLTTPPANLGSVFSSFGIFHQAIGNSWVWNFLGMKIEKTSFDKNPLFKIVWTSSSFASFCWGWSMQCNEIILGFCVNSIFSWLIILLQTLV